MSQPQSGKTRIPQVEQGYKLTRCEAESQSIVSRLSLGYMYVREARVKQVFRLRSLTWHYI